MPLLIKRVEKYRYYIYHVVRIKYIGGIELKGKIKGTNQVEDEKWTIKEKEVVYSYGNPITNLMFIVYCRAVPD